MKNIEILLIDDDRWIRDSLTLYFQEEGWRVLALETAEEGLEEVCDTTIVESGMPTSVLGEMDNIFDVYRDFDDRNVRSGFPDFTFAVLVPLVFFCSYGV